MQLNGDNASGIADTRFVIRNNPKVVFVELYHSAFSLVLFCVMVVGIMSRSDGWFKRLVLIFAFIYVLRIIYKPLSEWLLVDIEVSGFGVIYTSGKLFRKRKKMAWNDIAMLDRDSDPIREKLGGMKLSIVPVATKDDVCNLSFVSTDDVDKLFEVSERFSALNDRNYEEKQDNSELTERGGEVVFNSLSKADVLMLAIGYGEILFAVPIVASIADNLPLLGFNLTWDDASPWLLTRQLGVIGLAVAAIGVMSTYLVYGKWRVTSYGQSLEIESGVFTQKRASFPLHKSVFTTIKEPIGLKAFRKAQIRSISPASGQATKKNVIVPIIDRDDIPEVLAMLGAPTKLPQGQIQWLPLRILFFAIGSLLVFLLWFGLYKTFPQISSILLAAIFFLLIPITKLATTRLSFLSDNDGTPIYGVATYGIVNRTTQIADLRDINSLSVWRINIKSSRHLIFWQFRYIANGARALRGFCIITPSNEMLGNVENESGDTLQSSHHSQPMDLTPVWWTP